MLSQTLMPANMMANESSVRSAIPGFLSAPKRVKLPKLGLTTVPSAVLHRHLLHQLLHLQSPGSFFQPTRFLQSVLTHCPNSSSAVSRHHHSISSHWFQHTPLRHHGQSRRRTIHQARLRHPPLNPHQRHNTRIHLHLHPLLAPAVSLAGEMQSSVQPNCAQTRFWLRLNPIAFSARCAASGSSFVRIARSVRTHGSSTGANVSFDSQSHHFFSIVRAINHNFFCVAFSLRSEKKTKAKAVGSASHSGHATPASGDESSDNYEFDGEGDEMDTTEDADVAPDADTTDHHGPRYADLGSPADRYVMSLLSPPSKSDDSRQPPIVFHLSIQLLSP